MENNKQALLLAGKLANAARLVTTANTKNLSQRVVDMEEALDEYDKHILSLRLKTSPQDVIKDYLSKVDNVSGKVSNKHGITSLTINTGKGGAILFQEMLLGRNLTTEERGTYKDGVYEIGSSGISYLGSF